MQAMMKVSYVRCGVRPFLANCRNAVLEIASIRRQLEAVYIPGTPRFGSASIVAFESKDNDPVATALNRMDHYDELLAEKIEELEGALSLLETMICQLADGKSRAIARYYYGQGWTDARIAEELSMDERSIRRKRGNLVKQLDLRYRADQNPAGF